MKHPTVASDITTRPAMDGKCSRMRLKNRVPVSFRRFCIGDAPAFFVPSSKWSGQRKHSIEDWETSVQ
ncbi:hypothetical protein [Verrucosispora sp. WMMD573]|uniref:hypothetical protein n=1 Tax=Verrucosispora sp. WMMD573 TaxID=3015149 RepID=UPI00248AD906|nr:hypothetical protein [Verrucosispora sp. WMMD573]WBB53294.1 hypothetical protein O7601_22370 [Verrucosispora sp. WMMD573]